MRVWNNLLFGAILHTPSHLGVSLFNRLSNDAASMSNVLAEKDVAAEEQVQTLEHEMECPRCHDLMTLCSDFDCLYYICEDCDFCLYTIKKD